MLCMNPFAKKSLKLQKNLASTKNDFQNRLRE